MYVLCRIYATAIPGGLPLYSTGMLVQYFALYYVKAIMAQEIIKDRVRENTNMHVNAEIDRRTERNIEFYRKQSRDVILKRIEELDKEWDIERTLALNASVIAFTGTVLGIKYSKLWLSLPIIVTSFLAQHAIQGWCPPLTIFRRMNIRSRKEIDEEKYALLETLDKIEQ